MDSLDPWEQPYKFDPAFPHWTEEYHLEWRSMKREEKLNCAARDLLRACLMLTEHFAEADLQSWSSAVQSGKDSKTVEALRLALQAIKDAGPQDSLA